MVLRRDSGSTVLLIRILLILLLVCWAGVGAAQEETVGTVEQVQGQAQLLRGTAAAVGLVVGNGLYRSDVVETQEDSQLTVALEDGSSFTLAENTRVTIAQYVKGDEPRSLLQMARGRLRSRVSNAFSNRSDSYQVETREGVMGVQGTEFDVSTGLQKTEVFVFEGVVSVTSKDPNYPQPVLLRAGQYLSIALGEPLGEPVQLFQQSIPSGSVDDVLGSGGSQSRISGGDQSLDPTRISPELPDRISDDAISTPPRPNPPGKQR